ncbi:MAG: general secretion pathway protein GspK [Alphaproteobacteria bacterium]|nr:general secretion pathway protein GspK [Alphaproteobacteria bacterium]
MTRFLARTWRMLTTPRSLSDLRAPAGAVHRLRSRNRRQTRGGIALLVVVTAITIMTVVVSDLAYTSRVRFLVAAHSTDRQQAYWLAWSGTEIYKLIIMADVEIGDSIEQFAGDLAIDGLIDMVPQINTGLLTMLMASDGGDDVDEMTEDMTDEERKRFESTGSVSDEVRDEALEEGGGLFSERSWLDLPGDFSAGIEKESCKINVNMLATATEDNIENSPTFTLMLGLLSGEEDEQWLRDRNLEARDLIANLADWVDEDSMRSGGNGGYEDNLYQNLEPGYLSKNKPFETKDEIRLVEGWQDDVFERFGDQFTIYGGGKIDLSCDDPEIYRAILQSSYVSPPQQDADVDRILSLISEHTMLYGSFSKPKDFVQFLQNQSLTVDSQLAGALTMDTLIYRIESTGLVGTSAVTFTQVLEYDKRGRSTLLYHRVD